jgi:hypothetical protein
MYASMAVPQLQSAYACELRRNLVAKVGGLRQVQVDQCCWSVVCGAYAVDRAKKVTRAMTTPKTIVEMRAENTFAASSSSVDSMFPHALHVCVAVTDLFQRTKHNDIEPSL